MSQQQPSAGRIGAISFAVILAATIAPFTGAVETDVCGIEVLVDGQPLTEYRMRGTTYVEALEGREYSLRLTNRSRGRIAVALAVDGLNSIDAKTTSAERASKWVLGPFESTTISGWQMSADTARKFFFTTEEESYGAWLSETANLGVIEAVVFRERIRPDPLPMPMQEGDSAAGSSTRRSRPSAEAAAPRAAGKESADDLAATGIGRKVDHRVRRVHLDLHDQPAAKLRLRYEYRQQLVHLGVLPSPEEAAALDRRERARGFSDFEFAPDPYGRAR